MVYNMVHGIENTHSEKLMPRLSGQTARDQARRFQTGCPTPRVADEPAGRVRESLVARGMSLGQLGS